MYSLGIVVFEIWHPFSTGMERILTLRELVEKGNLPSAWSREHPKISKLVSLLTEQNPLNRPSAKDLLRSDYLPARVGDEQLQDLIRSLDDGTETYDRVIEGVFRSANAMNRSTGPGFTVSDLAGAPSFKYGYQVDIKERVCSTVKAIFSRHGAIHISSNEVSLAILG